MAKGPTTYLAKELTVLLKWFQIPPKEIPKGKAACAVRWLEILEKGLQPSTYERWTDDDETKLEEMKEFKIKIVDTALGRRRATSKRQLFSSIPRMSPEERDKASRMMDECKMAISPPNFGDESPGPLAHPSTSSPQSELVTTGENGNKEAINKYIIKLV